MTCQLPHFYILKPYTLCPKTLNPHYMKMRARSTTHTHKLFQKKKRDKSNEKIVMFSIRLSYR